MATSGTGKAKAPEEFKFAEVISSWRHWWRNAVVATVDQAEVISKRRAECNLTARYLFMLAMSAGIAVLGLLLSSPAVIIGAMLLSPLMDPIIGLGFALATGDFGWMKQAGKSLAIGTVLAILLTALVVFLSPLQTITPEIASRTRPNIFDLLIALFSALAGAYAMIRGREGTVVGVAIATALMPPLAVVGFGLATANGTIFWGALLLFVTNLLTIALVALVMARLYGFRTTLSERQTWLQTGVILAIFVSLAIPLYISLRQIVWETQSSRQINGAVMDAFDKRSRLSQIDIDFDAVPVRVSATVLTPELKPDAESIAARAIERQIRRPAQVTITQYEVGTSAKAAEAAQLASARASKEAADRQRAEELGMRLALVAGVENKDVVIDRERRRALVTARPIDGTSLGGYRELERRIAATEPDWRIELRPPALPLPQVAFKEGELTPEGSAARDLAIWASQRIHAPIVLSGTAANVGKLEEHLNENGIVTNSEVDRRAGDIVTLRWAAPE